MELTWCFNSVALNTVFRSFLEHGVSTQFLETWCLKEEVVTHFFREHTAADTQPPLTQQCDERLL